MIPAVNRKQSNFLKLAGIVEFQRYKRKKPPEEWQSNLTSQFLCVSVILLRLMLYIEMFSKLLIFCFKVFRI